MPDFLALPIEDLRTLAADPKMGEAALERINARIAELERPVEPPHPIQEGPSSVKVVTKSGHRRGKQNLTETRAFRMLIAPRIAKGEIVRAQFEAMTLHVHGVCKYTPDWCCWMPPECAYPIWLIEVKGAHIREKDVLRFKAATKEYPWLRFSMVQWDRKEKKWRVRYDKQPEVSDGHS